MNTVANISKNYGNQYAFKIPMPGNPLRGRDRRRVIVSELSY